MISADHPRFPCTSDTSLTIFGKIFSGPLVHTNDPSGTVLSVQLISGKAEITEDKGMCSRASGA